MFLAQPSLLPYRSYRLEDFDPKPDGKALKLANDWVDALVAWFDAGKPDGGPSVIFTSQRTGEDVAPGNGKTLLLVGALRKLAEMGYARVYKHERTGEEWSNLAFISSTDFLDEIRACYDRDSNRTVDEVIGRYLWSDVVGVDDIGTERTGDDATSKLFRLIDKRWLRPNGYTSNYDFKQLNERSPEWAKLTSRMRSQLRGVVLHGPDRRKPSGDPWRAWNRR